MYRLANMSSVSVGIRNRPIKYGLHVEMWLLKEVVKERSHFLLDEGAMCAAPRNRCLAQIALNAQMTKLVHAHIVGILFQATIRSMLLHHHVWGTRPQMVVHQFGSLGILFPRVGLQVVLNAGLTRMHANHHSVPSKMEGAPCWCSLLRPLGLTMMASIFF